jgi:hypothetical protein
MQQIVQSRRLTIGIIVLSLLPILSCGTPSVSAQVLKRWIPATVFGDSATLSDIWRLRDGSFLIRHGTLHSRRTIDDDKEIYTHGVLSNIVFDADSLIRKDIHQYTTWTLPYERGNIIIPPIEIHGDVYMCHRGNLLRINEKGVVRIPVCLDSISSIESVLPLDDGTVILSAYERLEQPRGDTFALPTVIATGPGDTCNYIRRLFSPVNGYLSHMNVTSDGVIIGASYRRRNKKFPLLSTIDGKGIPINGIDRPEAYKVNSLIPSPSGGWFVQLESVPPETRFTLPLLALELDREFNVIHKQVYEPNIGGTHYRDQGDAYMALNFGSVQFMWRSGRQSVTINADFFKDVVPSRLPITPVDGIVQGDSLIVVCQTGIAIITLPSTSVNESKTLIERLSKLAIVRGTQFPVAKTGEQANRPSLLIDAFGRASEPLYNDRGDAWLVETAHLASGLWHVRTATQTIPFLVFE